jgi:hypothetical protein
MTAATVNDIPELRRRLTELGYKDIDFGDTYGIIRGIVVDGNVVSSRLFDADPLTLDEQSRKALNEAINNLTVDYWIDRVQTRAPVGMKPEDGPKVAIRPSPMRAQ